MLKRIITGFIISLIPLLTSCVTRVVQSPLQEPVVLSSPGSDMQCNTVGQENQWYALWGLVPINDVDISPYIKRKDRTYRIVHQISPWDVAITAGGGFLVTITRTTLEVQECEEGIYILGSGDPVEYERNRIRHALSEYQDALKENRLLKNNPVVLMKNGDVAIGHIRQINEDEIQLEQRVEVVKEVAEEDSSSTVVYEDQVLMKDGATRSGKIINQDMNSILITGDLGEVKIPRNLIQNIRYHVPIFRMITRTVRDIETKKILLDRNEVERIILYPESQSISY